MTIANPDVVAFLKKYPRLGTNENAEGFVTPVSGSQIYEDDSKLTGISFASQVCRRLIVAEDALATMCFLILRDEVPLFTSHTLLRSAIECCASIDYLIREDTFEKRTKRLALMFSDDRTKAKANGFEFAAEDLKTLEHLRGITGVKKGERLPFTSEIVGWFSKRYTFQGQSHLSAWQRCSSIIHGKSWFQRLAVEVVPQDPSRKYPYASTEVWQANPEMHFMLALQAAHALAVTYDAYANLSGTQPPKRFTAPLI